MKKVTLTKSLIGCKPNQKATAKSLGLNRVGDSIVHADDAVLSDCLIKTHRKGGEENDG